MSLPFNLQRLPPEAISVLRFLGRRNAAATTQEMDDGLDIGTRAVGRAIRRLVNYSLIQMDFNSAYQLTGDGRRAYQQLAEAESVNVLKAAEDAVARPVTKINRRLTVVLPPATAGSRPIAMYIGVNPPGNGDPLLGQTAHIELRLSAVGAELSTALVSLDVPLDKAANPAQIMVAPNPSARAIRVRIDAFQTVDIDRIEPAGGMYFDIPVNNQPVPGEATRRAVGFNMMLM